MATSSTAKHLNANAITPAEIDWQTDENGNTVPVSRQFGDVYYSLVDGLAESRYVFLEQNHLSERFEQFLITPVCNPTTFTIAELGFGTGLNFFATWELWQTMRYANPSAKHHLHFISFEKFPLNKADFIQSLAPWKVKAPELAPLIDKFTTNYPSLIAGCHRFNFISDNVTIDIWFGDARENLQKLSIGMVNAWFLDGFAPSCNESLWAEQIFTQIARLSSKNSLLGTTVSTFSCAGAVKRGLTGIGFDIAKVKGFGRKREMLTAQLERVTEPQTYTQSQTSQKTPISDINTLPTNIINHVCVIGAGVSGLMSAWSLANRGFQVTLIDKVTPLAGASGNPRGVLAPKMTPIHHVEEHLHSIGYLYSSRLYRQMAKENSKHTKHVKPLAILETTGVMDLMLKANISCDQIKEYPDDFVQVLDTTAAQEIIGLPEISLDALQKNQFLPQAGLINPQALAHCVLAHPAITFEQHDIVGIYEHNPQPKDTKDKPSNHKTVKHKGYVELTTADASKITAEYAVVCLAYESCRLDKRIFDFRKIRGQISWFTPTTKQLTHLPKIPLKYGGYCARFTNNADSTEDKNNAPQFLLGASFVRNDTSSQIRKSEHQDSRKKLLNAIPELENVISSDTADWQARVGVRSQTPDYHPLVGKVEDSNYVWTLSGMGAKGYAFAPICAEVLADLILENIPPVSSAMLKRLSPNRQRLKTPLDETK